MNTDPEPVTRLRPAAPEELARIVEQLLRKDRDARYASAEALLADLRVLKTGLTAEKQDVAVLRLKKFRIYPGAPMADNAYRIDSIEKALILRNQAV